MGNHRCFQWVSGKTKAEAGVSPLDPTLPSTCLCIHVIRALTNARESLCPGSCEFHHRRGQTTLVTATTTPHSPGLRLTRKVACLQREMEVHPTLGQGRATHTYWNFLVYRIFWREKVEGDGEWQEGVPSSTTSDFPSTPVAAGT